MHHFAHARVGRSLPVPVHQHLVYLMYESCPNYEGLGASTSSYRKLAASARAESRVWQGSDMAPGESCISAGHDGQSARVRFRGNEVSCARSRS
jgi:hypothetical protein